MTTTTNPSITKTWAKVADAANTSTVIQSLAESVIEIATVSGGGAAPTSSTFGLKVDYPEVVTRTDFLAGDVYVRIAPNSKNSSASILLII